jgi:hypothetical protein
VNARVYLNTSTLAASSSIDGGGFTPPTLRAFGDVIFRFRLSREIEGQSVPDDRPIDSVTARIGYQDSAPTSGAVTLDITVGGNTKTTASLAYDATAAQVKTALDNALTSPLNTLAPVTVDAIDEGYRIVFADADETVTVSAATNTLWPLSFVNADRIEFNGGWATILGYRQAPVAEVAAAEETVAPEPTITREQAGSTTDGVAINEVQKILLSPSYAGGTWRLVWDGVKGAILPGFPTVEQLQEALDALAPSGGIFTLIAVEDGVLVEFAGAMAGEGQELMTAEEFTPPPTEYVVVLPTATAAMRTLMAGAGTDSEVEIPMDITVTVEDDSAADNLADHTFPFLLTFSRPVSDDSRNVSASLDWTQPLSRVNNLAFSPDSLLVGNRAIRKVIGDGAATSFVVNHNLGSLSGTFTADASTDVCSRAAHNFHNGDPVTVSSSNTLPAGLTAGTTYYIVSATTGTFKLSATPGGSAVNITSAGSGTHTVTMADGTTDVVFVEVWEAAGLKRRVSPEDYTVAITTDDSITISAFASTPTAGQYLAVVQTAGRPATYQAHTHAIAEITGLQAILDAQSAAIAALQATSGNLGAINNAGLTSGKLTRYLGGYFAMPGVSTLPEAPGTLLGWNPYALPLNPLSPARLQGAVHLLAASVENLPTPLPAASSTYVGRVFTTATARTDFPKGGLLAGDHAACDGRTWYRVARNGSETTWYPQTYELELFRFAVTTDDLVTGSVLDLNFGIEAALFTAAARERTRRSGMRWTLLVEYGTQTADSTPATTGANLDTYFSSPTTMLSYTLYLSEKPWNGRFGITVTRPSAGAITATATKMFKTAAALAAPSTGNFAIRARLTRGDVEDAPTDPKGLIAVRGFDVGGDGQPDDTLGKYSITS